MRTTVEFDADTAKAIEKLRQAEGRGVSDAVNELIRRGLNAPSNATRFVPRTRDLGISIDVSNVSDAIDLLEGPDAR